MSACFIVYCVRLLSSIRGLLLQPDLLLCFPWHFSCTTLIFHASICAPKGSRTIPTCSHLCLFYTRTCVEQPLKNPKLKKRKGKKNTQTELFAASSTKKQLRTDCGVNGQNIWDKGRKHHGKRLDTPRVRHIRYGPIRIPHCLWSQMRVMRCLSVEVFPFFWNN